MIKKTLGTDFTKGNIIEHMLRFLTPFLLANILNSIYNTVDMVIIGMFAGSVGTVAVAQGGKLLNVFTHLSMALSGAGQVTIGQQIGAKQEDQVSATIGTLFSILAIIAIVISGFSLMFSKQILIWLKTPDESFVEALVYLRITSLGFILTYGYNAVCSVLRGMGESKMPLLFIAISACVNIILDLVFVGVFNMGIVGVAIATIIGQGTSLIFSIIFLYRRKEYFGFDFKLKSFAIKRDKLKVILGIGLPMSASSFCIQFTQLIMISFVNQYGLIQAAAFSIADKIVHLTNIVTQSIRQAGGSMVAQNLGAGEKKRVKEIVKAALIITLSFATILSILSLLFPESIFKLFSNDIEVIAYSKGFLMIASATYFLAALSGSFDMVTVGSGFAKLSFIAGFVDGVILRISLGLLFGIYFDMQALGFFLGHSLARLSPVCIHAVHYFGGSWEKRKLLIATNESTTEVNTF